MKWFTNVIPSSVVLLAVGLVLSGGCQPEPAHENKPLDNDALIARSALQLPVFDFIAQSPGAQWLNNNGGIAWGGINNALGTVQKITGVLEDNLSHANFLNTLPMAVPGGVVQGGFSFNLPAATLHPTLIATFGFQAGASATDGVTFSITTQINGAWVELFSQRKMYTGALSTVAVDLSPYSGLTTQLFLSVNAGVTGIADLAAWTDVRITADSLTAPPSTCVIGGANVGVGGVNLAVDCQICDPISSAVAWTTRGDSCLIDGQCYIAGTPDTTGCLKCVPGTSQVSWTPQATCDIPGLVTVQNYNGTPMGTLQAVPQGNAWAFLGVPYAAPPTGSNRFAPPKPVTSWSGIQHHLVQAGPCVQKGFFPGVPNGYIGNEDCLYLNVWQPKTATSTSNLPVLVFHHGGGLMFGASAAVDDVVGTGFYDGDRLAVAQNMIVVTIQTRLAALGYLASTELSADATSKTNPNGSTSGNYGLLDALQALKWIKKNIRAFGGDPDHVTISGQSGGATLATMLLSSPLAKDPADNKPYFSSAFLMSGFYEEPSMATRYNQAAAVMPSLKANCTDNSTGVNCLRSAPVSNFANAAGDFLMFVPNILNGFITPDLAFGLPFGPSVDGYVVPNEPRATFAAGQHQKVPVIMGGTHDEFNTFMVLGVAGVLHAAQTLDISNMIMLPTCTDFTNRANLNLGTTLANAALPLYPCTAFPNNLGPTLAYAKAMTHAQYECPLRRTAAALAQGQTQPVRRYMFTHQADGTGVFQNLLGLARAEVGAAHALDVPYVFNSHETYVLGLPTYIGASPRELDLTTRYQSFIRAFAATGDPNNATLGTTWTAYSGSQDNLLSLKVVGETGPSDPGPQMVSGIDLQSGAGTSNCSFWDQNFALNASSPPACTPSCSGKVCGSDSCGGTCGTCGSGLLCSANQSSCLSTVAFATVSGFSKCSCLNGSFPLTNTNGVWSSQPITGCPLQSQPAYVKLIQSTGAFGITNQNSQPGSGNSDYSPGTIISTSPYQASGNGSTAGNINSFCPGREDADLMHWTVGTGIPPQRCYIDTTLYNPGDRDSTGCNECNPAVSNTSWTPRIDPVCNIGGRCYSIGDTDRNGCFVCNPSHSTTAWSSSGEACGNVQISALPPSPGNFTVASADSSCASQAAAYGKPGTWKALLSGSGRNMKDLVTGVAADKPVVNLSGDLLFPSWNSIFTGGQNWQGTNITRFDNAAVTNLVWTGTNFDGTAANTCSNWTATGYTYPVNCWYCCAWPPFGLPCVNCWGAACSGWAPYYGQAGNWGSGRLLENTTWQCNDSWPIGCVRVDPPACVPNCYAAQCGSDGCGGTCGTCARGETCTSTGFTQQCLAATSCKDGVRNGDETDVDCGGSCYPCLTGKSCSVAADCATNNCAAGVCGPQRFQATGAAVYWKVPYGATRLDVKMWGAGGGGSGGAGGYSSGSFQVSDGQTITIIVGGVGSAPSGASGGAGGFGGGGNGGDGIANQYDCGGYGGGGRSEVTGHWATIIAGGGGGSGCGGTTGTWGAGGGPAGGTGSQTGACYGNGTGGGSGGGAAGTTPGSVGIGCADGLIGAGLGWVGTGRTGGNGGQDRSGSRGRGGGGGGGGAAGGGGGGSSDSWSAGVGGGGSGLTVPGGSTVAGSNTTPGNSSDPDRQGAGAPGASGVVILTPY